MSTEDIIIKTKAYYNSKEADEFHQKVLGGEDIHIGIYDKTHKSIKEGSQKTIIQMIKKLPSIKKSSRILDIGSGYGGAARYLAEKYSCKIDCLNLSETENKRNEALNKAAGVENLITVTTGNFEQIPFDRETYDIVWCQDALFHSAEKTMVFREVARVLKSEGRFIFTDPMKTADSPEDALEELKSTLHIEKFPTIQRYKRLARTADLERVFIRELPEQLVTHFTKVLEALNNNKGLAKKSNKTFLDQKKKELQAWIDAGEAGYLTWGILQFQKRNT